MATSKLNWSKYDRSDFERIPGSRNYRLKSGGTEISRRQFDQHYGRLQGTTIERARDDARERIGAAQLLRPARGRKSGRKLSFDEREVEIARRQESAQAKRVKKKISTESARKSRLPKNLKKSHFKNDWIMRGYNLPLDQKAIDDARAMAQKSGIVFSYLVGVNLVDIRTGDERTMTYSAGAILISDRFTMADFEQMMDAAYEKDYAVPVSAFIKFKLKRGNYPKSRRGV